MIPKKTLIGDMIAYQVSQSCTFLPVCFCFNTASECDTANLDQCSHFDAVVHEQCRGDVLLAAGLGPLAGGVPLGSGLLGLRRLPLRQR